jgi:hypothetical protein
MIIATIVTARELHEIADAHLAGKESDRKKEANNHHRNQH